MNPLLFPSALAVTPNYLSGSGPSAAIWSKFAGGGLNGGNGRAVFLYDDFLSVGESVAVSSNIACFASQVGQYKAWVDTSATLAQLETAGTGGVLKFSIDATDNHEINLCQGGAGTSAATSVFGAINRDTNPQLTAFECRFKVSSVVDDVLAIFLGLMEENGGVHNAKVDDTGVTIDNDYIGFDSVHTNGGTTGTNAKLRFVYKKDGQTAQTVISTLQTMVADTWYKVGFVYDPFADAAKRITCYLDGSPKTTYITDTQMNAATFPDGEEMGLTAIAKSGTGTASNLQIDWWAVGAVV
jgi:hypothetical protein